MNTEERLGSADNYDKSSQWVWLSADSGSPASPEKSILAPLHTTWVGQGCRYSAIINYKYISLWSHGANLYNSLITAVTRKYWLIFSPTCNHIITLLFSHRLPSIRYKCLLVVVVNQIFVTKHLRYLQRALPINTYSTGNSIGFKFYKNHTYLL